MRLDTHRSILLNNARKVNKQTPRCNIAAFAKTFRLLCVMPGPHQRSMTGM
jgi:hypothetical protein